MHSPGQKSTLRGARKVRVGPRAQLACINCKTRKQKLRRSVGTVYTSLDETRRIENSPTCSRTPRDQTVEADESSSDLSNQVGRLGLLVGGEEPHYLGSSSAFSFSRLIHSSLRQSLVQGDPKPLDFHLRDTVEPSPCCLPDCEVAMSLSNAYFENIHPKYPFLHEPTFRRSERSLIGPIELVEDLSFDPVATFFVYMTYAIGALLLENLGSLSQQLYASAQVYIDNILSRNNLETIQAILSYTMYSLRSSVGPSVWKLSGLALRQCIELGYHRSSKQFGSVSDPLRLKLQKRVFWCAFGIDCVAALTLGRPLGIPLQEVDAELPMDIDDANVTETGLLASPRDPTSEACTTTSTALHVFRLRRIWAQIHGSLYSDVNGGIDQAARDHKIIMFRAQIDDWLGSVPPIPTRTGPALSIFATQDWYDLNYNETIVMLYRCQITGKEGDINGEVLLQCAKAAASIFNYTWSTLHVIFSAGLTYLHCLWASAQLRQETSITEMSAILTSCTMLLVVITERWKKAAPYKDVFEAFCSRTTSMMANRGSQQPLLRPSMESSSAETERFAEWMANISSLGMSEAVDDLLIGLITDVEPQEEAERHS
ncbi:fungal-specific transcription factor domain-containing protein [Fusarium solani]|uniref:Fungal-specific transcription factor domain-containing protein n=1 Tax=Fusarium solani TaxID=169388 RepID=A0A9P9FZI5_FUSSL|nr:fungal-specific transcription factor domain-containing protein [Fusarium solani]KAH7230359.1 fungal-specific transcription factor domain-containing protein [Fusarium solani]